MQFKRYTAALSTLLVCAAVSSNSLAALASKATGKAVTSANLSTNPTIRQQQLLCDPSGPDEPLILTYAKLDVAIHLDTPIGYSAQDIVQSIDVSPLAPHFLAVGTMPFYHGPDSSLGVTFNGQDILISNFTVQWNTDNPPPAGEVDHAVVDVQYNDLLPKAIYDNVLATFTVTTNDTSEIRGQGSESGDLFTFDAPNIIPATDSSPLGLPEPTTLCAGMLIAGISLLRRRGR